MSILIIISVVIVLGGVLFVFLGKKGAEGKSDVKKKEDNKIKLQLNGGKTVSTKKGTSVLSALSNDKIYLPSSCGGSGICGQCKIKINTEGEFPVTPYEKDHIKEEDRVKGYRLGCQTVCRQDMTIEVPPESLGAKKLKYKVKSVKELTPYIREVILTPSDSNYHKFVAGSYVEIDIPSHKTDMTGIELTNINRDIWEKDGISCLKSDNDKPTKRAYSMANYQDGSDMDLVLNVRLQTPTKKDLEDSTDSVKKMVGRGSTYMWTLKSNDSVEVSGPYGKFRASDNKSKTMVFIGGGAGMAPLKSIMSDQLEVQKTNRNIYFYYGARSRRELFYDANFTELKNKYTNFKMEISLSDAQGDDTWGGHKGYVHELLKSDLLDKIKDIENYEFYICGPKPMNEAVVRTLKDFGVSDSDIRIDDFGV